MCMTSQVKYTKFIVLSHINLSCYMYSSESTDMVYKLAPTLVVKPTTLILKLSCFTNGASRAGTLCQIEKNVCFFLISSAWIKIETFKMRNNQRFCILSRSCNS